MSKRKRPSEEIVPTKIQLRPVCLLLQQQQQQQHQEQAERQSILMLRLPVVLGRQNLASAWWKACPRQCQAWIPSNLPCVDHCRQIRLKHHLEALSRSMLEIKTDGSLCVTARHTDLVHWKGRKRLKHSTKGQLMIGKDPKRPWMKFAVTAVTDPCVGDWKVADPHRQRRQRIWLEPSSSSSSGTSGDCDGNKSNDGNNSVGSGNDESIEMHAGIGDENEDSPNVEHQANKAPLKRQGIHDKVNEPMPKNSQSVRPMIQHNFSRDSSQEPFLISGKLWSITHSKEASLSKFKAAPGATRASLPSKSPSSSNLNASKEENIITCQVVRRDYCQTTTNSTTTSNPEQNDCVISRKVTPDEKRRKLYQQQLSLDDDPLSRFRSASTKPLTQSTHSFSEKKRSGLAKVNIQSDHAIYDNDSFGPSQSSCSVLRLPGDDDEHEYRGTATSGSVAAAEMLTWQQEDSVLSAHKRDTTAAASSSSNDTTTQQQRRQQRACRDLCLSDWRHLHETAHPDSLLRATSDLVLIMNQGRSEDSYNLWLPPLLEKDATVL